MKWVVRIFGLIIGLFAIAAVAGFFSSPIATAERSVDVFSQAEDVFPYLSDLDDHGAWSPWHTAETREEYIVGGSDEGVGQQAAWTCSHSECLEGTEEISVIHYPEFVQSGVNLAGRSADATYALMSGENTDGSLTILIKIDLHTGDFPYVQRLFKFKEQQALEARLDAGLSRLNALIEADGKLE